MALMQNVRLHLSTMAAESVDAFSVGWSVRLSTRRRHSAKSVASLKVIGTKLVGPPHTALPTCSHVARWRASKLHLYAQQASDQSTLPGPGRVSVLEQKLSAAPMITCR